MAEGNGNGNGDARRLGVLAAIAMPLIAILGGFLAFYGAIQHQGYEGQSAKDKLAELERRVAFDEEKQATDRLDITTISANLREVETQFCSQSQTSNLIHANDMRVQAMLWQKTMKETLPTDNPFYPTLGCISKPEDVRR